MSVTFEGVQHLQGTSKNGPHVQSVESACALARQPCKVHMISYHMNESAVDNCYTTV